jgi:hypothetical protein
MNKDNGWVFDPWKPKSPIQPISKTNPKSPFDLNSSVLWPFPPFYSQPVSKNTKSPFDPNSLAGLVTHKKEVIELGVEEHIFYNLWMVVILVRIEGLRRRPEGRGE